MIFQELSSVVSLATVGKCDERQPAFSRLLQPIAPVLQRCSLAHYLCYLTMPLSLLDLASNNEVARLCAALVNLYRLERDNML